MNPVILTKIAKHTLIGSVSAYLSFAAKNNVIIQKFFYVVLAGTIITIVLVLLWEGREIVSQADENSLNTILNSVSAKPKRNYLLSTKARLELAIALIVIIACVMVGSL